MKKNIANLIILLTTVTNITGFTPIEAKVGKSVQASDKIEKKSNALRVFNDYTTMVEADKFDDFWTPENEAYLNETEKDKVNKLREKAENGDFLTGNEKNELKTMKVEVIRKKLGDEKFAELEKLIEKREGSTDLTLDERRRLFELEREAT